jgi:NAD(P)-dependent dehydrogenase (short-subunit alcohol dehydrogenase family)
MQNKHIVITGSTRGLGNGLARSFLELGSTVTISGRRQDAVNTAVADLEDQFDAECIFGSACDVTDPIQVQKLWDESVQAFGKVDIWVNNAGVSGEPGKLWEIPPEKAHVPFSTNVLGTVYGAQVAMKGMLSQGFGALYIMEGMGSDGRKHAGLTLYGTSKYALHYLFESLALEAKNTPIVIGSLRPGMVITDLIIERYTDRPDDLERAKKIFNIIADRVDIVSPWLAQRMLVNHKSGVILKYSSTWKLLWRFVSQPFMKRDLFS